MDEVVTEFLVESNEALDQIDLDFIALEKDPSSKDTLASVFRAIHTIKGTCGFLGFQKLESLTHVGETLLGRLRDGDLDVTADIITALLALSDAVREMLGCIEQSGNDGETEYRELAAQLTQLQENPGMAIVPAIESAPAQPAPAAAEDKPPAEEETATDDEPEQSEQTESSASSGSSESKGASVADRTVRVDVSLLDSLMNQVGELVLARNQILQYSSSQDDPVFVTTTQRLNLITTELQEDVMKTRMQPIGTIWNKFPRVVRDLSRTCRKRVRVEMEGEETELDRTIIEAIKDPLTHVVRNAVDHGIESPEDRIAAGKQEEGCVWLRAFHEGGHVNIEITDDGKGIDTEKVKDKAIRANLITPEQAARMGEREALNLIFNAGLSTAAKVTNISGRGVGMDVVKTNAEKIGGTVDIQSQVGHGSTLRVKIPLTLAIIPALIVTTGGDHYAIPQVCLLELVRLEGDHARKAVEMIHDVPVYRLRGNLLPIVWLNEQLGVGDRNDNPGDGDTVMNIAVLQADDRQFGLVVDEVNDNQEIVVKPLDKLLKGLSSYAGATIMGDGKVALILDALGLALLSGVISESRSVLAQAAAESADHDGIDEQTLLLFAARPGDRMAVPLSQVARLEEFDRNAVELAGERPVVQYRGEILPLSPLSDVLGESFTEDENDGPLQVIVYMDGDRSMGVIVHEILDIVQERVSVQQQIARPGITGTAVIQGQVTEIVDTTSIVEMAGLTLAAPV